MGLGVENEVRLGSGTSVAFYHLGETIVRHMRDTGGYPPRVVCPRHAFLVTKSLLFPGVFLSTPGGSAQAAAPENPDGVEPLAQVPLALSERGALVEGDLP